jgi:hypothetical protein
MNGEAFSPGADPVSAESRITVVLEKEKARWLAL